MTKVKKYDLAVFIGRMAPLHNAHLENIKLASDIGRHVLVVFGSANAPRDERNPFTNEQRALMLNYATDGFTDPRISYAYMNDMPSNDLWAAEVMRLAHQYEHPERSFKVAIVGHKKDDSSFYLDMFPTWDFIESGAHMHGDEEMAATKIREHLFGDDFLEARSMMPEFVWKYIDREYKPSELYHNVKAEFQFHKDYPENRRKKYPINDVTTDAVVLCKSHILLIRRKNIPGKGKLALPGGFLNTNETVEDGMLRELDEETKLHVPQKVLRKSITDVKVFDKPSRSLRGRILTFAHTVKIDPNNDGSLPRVYGSDDADKAFWEPISNIAAPENAAEFFEDHHNIIMTMIGRAAQQNN